MELEIWLGREEKNIKMQLLPKTVNVNITQNALCSSFFRHTLDTHSVAPLSLYFVYNVDTDLVNMNQPLLYINKMIK